MSYLISYLSSYFSTYLAPNFDEPTTIFVLLYFSYTNPLFFPLAYFLSSINPIIAFSAYFVLSYLSFSLSYFLPSFLPSFILLYFSDPFLYVIYISSRLYPTYSSILITTRPDLLLTLTLSLLYLLSSSFVFSLLFLILPTSLSFLSRLRIVRLSTLICSP